MNDETNSKPKRIRKPRKPTGERKPRSEDPIMAASKAYARHASIVQKLDEKISKLGRRMDEIIAKREAAIKDRDAAWHELEKARLDHIPVTETTSPVTA